MNICRNIYIPSAFLLLAALAKSLVAMGIRLISFTEFANVFRSFGYGWDATKVALVKKRSWYA